MAAHWAWARGTCREGAQVGLFGSLIQKFLDFDPLFYIYNGIKHHINFLAKSGYSLFWILVSRGQKSPKEPLKSFMRVI
jgi:hypothetical protein